MVRVRDVRRGIEEDSIKFYLTGTRQMSRRAMPSTRRKSCGTLRTTPVVALWQMKPINNSNNYKRTVQGLHRIEESTLQINAHARRVDERNKKRKKQDESAKRKGKYK
jgi:hypothetical protein